MKISQKTIEVLGSVITGDGKISPYRTGQQLVDFFNQFGTKDLYESGFPSRWKYAEDKLRLFNSQSTIKNIIVNTFDPYYFLNTEYDVFKAIEHFNKVFVYDDYEVKLVNKQCKVYSLSEIKINFSNPHINSNEITHIFINEQIEKCESKLNENDFDGAITNARSLVEAVLVVIERELDSNSPEYDGNLPKLYKRVQKLLNLCPEQEGLDHCLKQILSGFISVVSGLAALRNIVSDAHVRTYEPAEHHARLAVNSAKTMCNFLFDTKEYQIAKNKNA